MNSTSTIAHQKTEQTENIESRIIEAAKQEFIKKGLFEPRAENQNEEDENAIIRVIKVITSTLGLAWVNEKEKLHITDIGNKLLEKSNYEESDYNEKNKI